MYFKSGFPKGNPPSLSNGAFANLVQAQVCRMILRCGLSKRYAKHYCYGRGSEIDQSEWAGVCSVQGIPQPHAHPNKPLSLLFGYPWKNDLDPLLALGVGILTRIISNFVLICIFVYHCRSDHDYIYVLNIYISVFFVNLRQECR